MIDTAERTGGFARRAASLRSQTFDLADGVGGQAGKFETPSRAAVLVGNDPQTFSLARESQDGANKVVAGAP